MLSPDYSCVYCLILFSLFSFSLASSRSTSTSEAETKSPLASLQIDAPPYGYGGSKRQLQDCTHRATTSASVTVPATVLTNQHGLICVSVFLEKHVVFDRKPRPNNGDGHEQTWKVTVEEISTSSALPGIVDDKVTTMMNEGSSTSLAKQLDVTWETSPYLASLVDDGERQVDNEPTVAQRNDGDGTSAPVGPPVVFPGGRSSPPSTLVSTGRARCSFVIPLVSYSPSSTEGGRVPPLSAYAVRTFVVSLWTTVTTLIHEKQDCDVQSLVTRRLVTLPRVAHPWQTVDPVAKVILQHSSSFLHHRNEELGASISKNETTHQKEGSNNTLSWLSLFSWVVLSTAMWVPFLVGRANKIRRLNGENATQESKESNRLYRKLESESEREADDEAMVGEEALNRKEDSEKNVDAHDHDYDSAYFHCVYQPALNSDTGHGKFGYSIRNDKVKGDDNSPDEIDDKDHFSTSLSREGTFDEHCHDHINEEVWPQEEGSCDGKESFKYECLSHLDVGDDDEEEKKDKNGIGIMEHRTAHSSDTVDTETNVIHQETTGSLLYRSHGEDVGVCNDKDINHDSFETPDRNHSALEKCERNDEIGRIAFQLKLPETMTGTDFVREDKAEENMTIAEGFGNQKGCQVNDGVLAPRQEDQKKTSNSNVVAAYQEGNRGISDFAMSEFKSMDGFADNRDSIIGRIEGAFCTYLDASVVVPTEFQLESLARHQGCVEGGSRPSQKHEDDETIQCDDIEVEVSSLCCREGKHHSGEVLVAGLKSPGKRANHEDDESKLKTYDVMEVQKESISPYFQNSSHLHCDTINYPAGNKSEGCDGSSCASNSRVSQPRRGSEVTLNIQSHSQTMTDSHGQFQLVFCPRPISSHPGKTVTRTFVENGDGMFPDHSDLLEKEPGANDGAVAVARHSIKPTDATHALSAKNTPRSEAGESYESTLPPDSCYESDQDPFELKASDVCDSNIVESLHCLENSSTTQEEATRYSLANEAKELRTKEQEIVRDRITFPLSLYGQNTPEKVYTDENNRIVQETANSQTKRTHQESLDSDSVVVMHVLAPDSDKRGTRPYSKSNFVSDWIPSNGLQTVSQRFMNEESWNIAPAPDFQRSNGTHTVPKSISLCGKKPRRK